MGCYRSFTEHGGGQAKEPPHQLRQQRRQHGTREKPGAAACRLPCREIAVRPRVLRPSLLACLLLVQP